jgi:hypothetical protein
MATWFLVRRMRTCALCSLWDTVSALAADAFSNNDGVINAEDAVGTSELKANKNGRSSEL